MSDIFEAYAATSYSPWNDPHLRDSFRGQLEAVRAELGRDYPLTIGGEQVMTGSFISSFDPGKVDRLVGRVAAGGPEQIDQAFDAAQLAYREWSRWPMEDRARLLVRLAAVLRRRKRELAAWEVFEASKNWLEAEADVAEAIDFCEYYARRSLALGRTAESFDYPGEENTTFYIPMGVGVVIPPWNFLLAILVGTAVGPVVVGNTVIVKPSPSTPVIAAKFMECVAEAGFPPGVINMLAGEDAVLGDRLVDDQRTRFINFTGSRAVGLRISQRASYVHPGQRFLKRVMAELGGKNALIVDETADLSLAVDAAVASAFGFQGQKCSAMSRLILVDQVYDEVLERFVTASAELSLGHAEEDHDVAAVINQKQYDRIGEYLERGRQEGRLLLGGPAAERPEGGYFVPPTIFADVEPAAAIAQEEIFGPVVAVMRASDFDEALAIANGTDYALTGGVMSRDSRRLRRAVQEFEVGNLYINRKITGSLVGIQPFGGTRLSGTNSKAGGPDYLKLFMEAKTVTERFSV
jgi:1-pyrroline-5-carboxylate dehydrogenase